MRAPRRSRHRVRPMTVPAVILASPRAPGAPAYFEAYWRVPQPSGRAKPVKRRLGKAWVEPDGDGGWRPRPSPCPDGWLTRGTALAAAPRIVERYGDEQAAAARVPTFRQVAWEWHAWKRDVKGVSLNTVRNDRYFLLEPGTPAKRGSRVSEGRIMAAWGDSPIGAVSAAEASAWLRSLQAAGLSPRNVNLHRSVLHAIFNYAMRTDTYDLAANPFAKTPRLREG